MDGRTDGSKHKQTAAELFFSFGKVSSATFQSTDSFIWHLGLHAADILAGFASCVGFVKNNEQQKPPALCC